MPLEDMKEESMDSILTSIKKLIGITEEDTTFDIDIIIAINSAFTVLNQLGVGPEEGFTISDDMTNWDEFLPEGKQLELVKTYIYLKVKLIFDPPSSSTVLEAFQRQVNECEWRLNVAVDPAK